MNRWRGSGGLDAMSTSSLLRSLQCHICRARGLAPVAPRSDALGNTHVRMRQPRRRLFQSSSKPSRPPLSNSSRAKPLRLSLGPVSPEDFAEACLAPGRPAVLKGLVAGPSTSNPYHWPAVDAWPTTTADGSLMLDGMRERAVSSLMVPVEIQEAGCGYNAQSSGWERIEMPFGLFLDAFVNQSIPSQSPSQKRRVGYMAQHDLLSAAPSLSAACPRLPHTTAGERGAKEQWQCNTWVGPADCFTPIHRDPYHNLFVQVVGRKRVHFFSPACEPLLSLQQSGRQTNTSVIDREDSLLHGASPQSQEEQLLQTALAHEQTAHTELEAGDAVYLPLGWFHCVRSLTTSASVNFWFR